MPVAVSVNFSELNIKNLSSNKILMTRLWINFNFEHPDGSTYNDLFGTLVFIKIHFNLVQVLIVPLNKARPRNSNINIRYASRGNTSRRLC